MRVRCTDPRAQHARADHDDQQPETRSSHGYRSSGSMYCERASVTRPSANTPIVWVTVTVAPSATACRGRAARADQVGGDHRLAVAGRQRVQRAPAEGGEEQEHQHALARRGVLEQAGEAVARCRAVVVNVAALAARRDQRAVAGPRPRSSPRGGRAGCPAGPPDSGAGRRLGRRSGVRVRTAVPSPGSATIALQPTRPAKVPSRSRTARGESDGGAQRNSKRVVSRPPLPRGKVSRGSAGQLERDAPAVDGQLEAAAHLVALALEHLGARQAALLDGRDLRLVEDVAHVDPVVRDPHRC